MAEQEFLASVQTLVSIHVTVAGSDPDHIIFQSAEEA